VLPVQLLVLVKAVTVSVSNAASFEVSVASDVPAAATASSTAFAAASAAKLGAAAAVVWSVATLMLKAIEARADALAFTAAVVFSVRLSAFRKGMCSGLHCVQYSKPAFSLPLLLPLKCLCIHPGRPLL
jgi:hypothetical protein